MIKKTIIADTSPLIGFARINKLDLLFELLGTLVISEAVKNKSVADLNRPGAKIIYQALRDKKIEVYPDSEEIDPSLSQALGLGEATAITLAKEQNALLFMDEKLGRAAAKKINVAVIGTAGILLLAKREKKITAVRPILRSLKNVGYFLSESLMIVVLTKASE